MQTETVNEQAHPLLENLPDSATREDLICRIDVRQAIEVGIEESEEGEYGGCRRGPKTIWAAGMKVP